MSRAPSEFASHPAKFPAPAFRAVVKHVVDGDTLDCLVDQGFNSYRYVTVRLADVDTPELRGGTPETRAQAQAARDFVRALVQDAPVLLETAPDPQTFGRYVARVFVPWDSAVARADLTPSMPFLELGLEFWYHDVLVCDLGEVLMVMGFTRAAL